MRSLVGGVGFLVALAVPAGAQEFSYSGQPYANLQAFCDAVHPSWNGSAVGVTSSGTLRCGTASMTTVGALGMTRDQYITNYTANSG